MSEKIHHFNNVQRLLDTSHYDGSNVDILPNNRTLNYILTTVAANHGAYSAEELEDVLEVCSNLLPGFEEKPISDENIQILRLVIENVAQKSPDIYDVHGDLGEIVELYEERVVEVVNSFDELSPKPYETVEPPSLSTDTKPKLELAYDAEEDEIPLMDIDQVTKTPNPEPSDLDFHLGLASRYLEVPIESLRRLVDRIHTKRKSKTSKTNVTPFRTDEN